MFNGFLFVCFIQLEVNFMTLNVLISFHIIQCLWDGDLAQWLRVLGVLAKDLGSVSSTHMVVHDHL